VRGTRGKGGSADIVCVRTCLLGACSTGIGDQVVVHVVLCLVLGAMGTVFDIQK
jgi:hypothetical protein